MKTRDEWLALRRQYLTASDVAAVLGVDPWRGPIDVYADKIGKGVDEDRPLFKWGRDVEGAIALWYERESGRSIEDLGATEIQVHSTIPWLAATLDRVTWRDEDRGPLEIKAVSHKKKVIGRIPRRCM